MTTETETLHARLARVLESLPTPRGLNAYPTEWADRCLSDANAAIALVQEHGPRWVHTSWFRDIHEWEVLLVDVDKLGYVQRYETRGATQQEALMAAFVAWKESEASNE